MDDYYNDSDIEGSRDRFSELPDLLIHFILSFLPMRDVVKTTFLSKRWNNLWTTVSYIDLCEHRRFSTDEEVERARNFLNRALAFWVGTRIQKLIFDFRWGLQSPLVGEIDSWVRVAVDNNVEDLKIHLSDDPGLKEDAYMVPQCLNSCSSIRQLSLVGCNLRIPELPPWNQLRSLKINGFRLTKRLINRILLGSPRLEVFELRLLECKQDLNIRSTSLKKLKIEKYVIHDEDQPSEGKELRIHCPNLDEMEISGILYFKYNFSNISSLTAATFRLYCHRNGGQYADELLKQMFIKFFSAARRVERLTLEDWNIKVISDMLLRVPNVKFLEIDVWDDSLQDLMYLFEMFPNLKMVFIEDQSFMDRVCRISDVKLSEDTLKQLKTIELNTICGALLFDFVEAVLQHASTLEKFVILPDEIISRQPGKLLEIAEVLLSLPRSSPTVNVIIDKE